MLHYPITFSVTAEDPQVVERALRLRDGDLVVSIASAGDTALNLLASADLSVQAVDISFPQLCLARVKIEAMRRLSLEEFRTFCGLQRGTPDAVTLYRRHVRAGLGGDVQRFWDRHRYMLERGLLWQGGFQRLASLLRRAVSLALGQDLLGSLSKAETCTDALRVFDRALASPRVRFVLRALLNRYSCACFYPSVGLRHLPPGDSVRSFSIRTVREMLGRQTFHGNPYLSSLIFGAYPSLDCVPPYLHARHYPTIRRRLDRVELVHADIREHLRAYAGRPISGFALGNCVDWMSGSDIQRLVRSVLDVAARGARCLMQSRRTPFPLSGVPGARSLDEVSEEIRLLDRTGYYRSASVLEMQDRP